MTTLLHPGDSFRISHQEMIKGIRIGGTGKTLSFFDTLEIPIIGNTADEEDLTDGMAAVSASQPHRQTMKLTQVYARRLWKNSRMPQLCWSGGTVFTSGVST
jgi:methylthioribulose-1-phosphate dehydratase